MEYAKDEIFQVRYTTNLNKLQMKGESWTSRWGKKMKKHKLLTMCILAFFMFATMNIVMIYSFMKILQNLSTF